MLYAYQTPGVYFEWQDHQPPVIGRRRTDIAGFVGIAASGPLHKPVKIESWTQFVSTFGSHIPQSYLAYAVEGFFANGGQTCWVVRVADPQLARPASLDLLDETGRPTLRLTAYNNSSGMPSPGVWGNEITVSVTRGSQDRFSLRLGLPDGRQETWFNLSMKKKPSEMTRQKSALPQYVEDVLNDPVKGSRLVKAKDLNPPASQNTPEFPVLRRLGGGRDGLAPAVDLTDKAGQPTLRLTASGSRSYKQQIRVSVVHEKDNRFTLDLEQEPEPFKSLSMDPNDARYVETVLNDRRKGSQLVTAKDLYSPSGFPENTPAQVTTKLTGGLQPEHFNRKGATADLDWGLATLEAIDAVSIVAMPDIMSAPVVRPERKAQPANCHILKAEPPLPPAPEVPLEFPPRFDADDVSQLQYALIAHCEMLKDRVAILDPLRDHVRSDTSLPDLIDWRDQFDTKYAALYYPWLQVPDPLALGGLLRTIPPSGHVAGVYARVDRQVGVHKPPANELVEGVKSVSVPTNDRIHGELNNQSINVIRVFNGRGLRIAGARTLSSDIEWRYINVRRLLIMIAEAVNEDTQWTVFEPNNPSLWLKIERVTRNFLDDLWQRGMLDGATAEEAYSARCDESTNPPYETDQGRLICEIGLNPPWPAEFVIVRLGKTEGGLEILDEMRTQNG